jgi:F-type H+-transporting ATPase subunit gamma
VNFPISASIAHKVCEHVTDDIDTITIVYNEFKNVITQIVRKIELLNEKQFVQ